MLGGIDIADPDAEGPDILATALQLAGTRERLSVHPVLGRLPTTARRQRGLAASLHRRYGRMPWTSRHGDRARIYSIPVGGHIDIARYVEHFVDMAVGGTSEPRVFRDLVPGFRDVTTALLLDGRTLFLDRTGEAVPAPDTFMLVCSYNPAYRHTLKELKPSFRQRFVSLALDYLPTDREIELLVAETGVGHQAAARLVRCASSIRNAEEVFHLEPPSTRTLVTAAHLVAAGVSEPEAADVCILGPLSSDGTVTDALREVAAASLLPADVTTALPL